MHSLGQKNYNSSKDLYTSPCHPLRLMEGSASTTAALDRLIRSTACPRCRATLWRIENTLRCSGCGDEFPIQDGIPLLARHGSAETWSKEALPDTSCSYQLEYQQLDRAVEYNEAYRVRTTKRWSTRRERWLLRKLLSSQGHCEALLNIPCGGGRLTDVIAVHASTLIEADIALGQLRYAREQGNNASGRIWMTASAFHMPFQDESIDGVVCSRLCHHLPTEVERERVVAELLRVARRFVVMTFFDYHSPKNYLRRMRRPFNGKPPKMTMTCDRLSALAVQHGAMLVESPALAYPFSGHRYALMVKRKPGGDTA